MRRALALAASVRTRTSPNPWVGAVVVTADGRALRGGHGPAGRAPRRGGGPGGRRRPGPGRHAVHDARALRPPRADPAVHRGHRRRRGGPGGGGRRSTPTPRCRGGGSPSCARPGIAVDVGVAADEAAELLAPYLKHRAHRPALGRAQAGRHPGRADRRPRRHGALDHRATRPGPTPIACGRCPTPCSSGPGRCGPTTPSSPCGSSPSPSTSRCGSCSARRPTGARVHPALEMAGEPGAVLDELGAKGVLQVLVEGGARVAHAFHRGGVVDRYVLYLAPALFGGDDAVPMFGGPGAPTVEDLWRGRLVSVAQLGDDVRVELAPADGPARHGRRRSDGVTELQRRSRTPSRRSAAARSSWWSTTRTARTRATSSWRPRRPPPRRSPSSWPTPRA